MAGLDSLNDLQRATLQLLLKQGKSYDEIAALLKTNASAVQSRAHEAVAALGPASPDIGEDRRNEVTDYLLGQQGASRRAATREYLEDSADGRSWARPSPARCAPSRATACPRSRPSPPRSTRRSRRSRSARPARRRSSAARSSAPR